MAVLRTLCYGGSATPSLTAGTADFTWTSLVADALQIRAIYSSTSGSAQARMTEITPADMAGLRLANSASGVPIYYAFNGPNQFMVWPAPGTSTTIAVYYVKAPLVLVEASPVAGTSESTPTAFPSAFHYDVLGNLAVAMGYEYKREQAQSSYYRQLAEVGMDRLVEWVNSFGGYDQAQYSGGPAFGVHGKGNDLW